MLRSDANHLYFDGRLKGDFLPVSAALHNLIQRQGYQDVILDFRGVTFADASFMLPLVATCRAYRGQRIDFDLVMPGDSRIARHIHNTNWAYLIAPETYSDNSSRNERHLSALQFRSSEEHHRAVDSSMNLLLALAPNLDRNRLKALEWALNEITDNVLNHADSPIGGIMQVVTHPRRPIVEFLVCDAGATIPRTLRQGHPEIRDDTTALRKAIEEGVTRNSQTNQGNGLYGTFKCCEVSRGEFEVLTGCVRLTHRPGQLSVVRSTIPVQGTFVRATIDYSFDKLLEKALVFKGRAHDPSFDYVERMYQTDADHVRFLVKEEVSAFGSREAGRQARIKIENLMDRRRVPVEFDFEDVKLISSSCADEVFGKLFADLGPLQFNQLCRFRNVDSTVQGLIDRSIAQRIKALYS